MSKSGNRTEQSQWPAQLRLSSFGVRLHLRADDNRLLQQLLPHLPAGWKPLAASATAAAAATRLERCYSIWHEASNGATNYCWRTAGKRLMRAPDWETLTRAFENDVQLHVAEHAPRRVFIHAGVVGYRGRAIVIPGRSFSGKTSLTAALVRAGAIYYSDEYAVLDDQGRVHSFAKPLSIREGGNYLGTPYQVESLGGRQGKKALPVGLIVVSRYRKGAKWQPRALSPGQSALNLLANAVAARSAPQRVMLFLQRAVRQSQGLEGARGEADEVARALMQVLQHDH